MKHISCTMILQEVWHVGVNLQDIALLPQDHTSDHRKNPQFHYKKDLRFLFSLKKQTLKSNHFTSTVFHMSEHIRKVWFMVERQLSWSGLPLKECLLWHQNCVINPDHSHREKQNISLLHTTKECLKETHMTSCMTITHFALQAVAQTERKWYPNR